MDFADTSAPGATWKAMGTRRRLATSAVVRTGRRRVSAASRIASFCQLALRTVAADEDGESIRPLCAEH